MKEPNLRKYKEYTGFSVVYKITNSSGQIYVGATTNLYERLRLHKRNRLINSLIAKSINSSGFGSHSVEVIWKDSSSEKLFDMEKHFIAKLNSCYIDNPNGLNSRRSNNDNEHLKTKMMHQRSVYKYDLLTGDFIEGYTSIHLASDALGKIGGYKNISQCCYKRKRYAYKFYWSFDKVENYKPKKSWKNKKFQQVYKLHKDGTIIRDVYSSIAEAADKNNLSCLEMFRAIDLFRVIENSIFLKVAS